MTRMQVARGTVHRNFESKRSADAERELGPAALVHGPVEEQPPRSSAAAKSLSNVDLAIIVSAGIVMTCGLLHSSYHAGKEQAV